VLYYRLLKKNNFVVYVEDSVSFDDVYLLKKFIKINEFLSITRENRVMKQYTLKSIQVKHDVIHLILQPRRPKDRSIYKPGQYATIGFRSDSGRRSPMRCFSIVSSPANPNELEFAMRLGGKFTQAIAALKAGTIFFVQGPFGEFVANERYDRHLVLIAGGIGITPFMSMIRTACLTNATTPITLLYNYRNHHLIPFFDELQTLAQQNPRLRVFTFVTDSASVPNTPQILSGRITNDHIAAVTTDRYAGSTYFICGPKGFNESTVRMLAAHDVSDDRIITEAFTQSSKLAANNGLGLQKLTYGFSALLLVASIGSIAYLDLSRYVPHYEQTANKVQSDSIPQSSGTATKQETTSTNTQQSSTTTPASGSTSPSTSTDNNSSSQQNYQAPVTSQS
jgi:ferredoxin-NADP reductase